MGAVFAIFAGFYSSPAFYNAKLNESTHQVGPHGPGLPKLLSTTFTIPCDYCVRSNSRDATFILYKGIRRH